MKSSVSHLVAFVSCLRAGLALASKNGLICGQCGPPKINNLDGYAGYACASSFCDPCLWTEKATMDRSTSADSSEHSVDIQSWETLLEMV